MKKSYKLLSLILSALMVVTLFSGCGKKEVENKELVKIRLNEVVRSIFYAPMYAAINQSFFKEQGLDIELSTDQGAEAT
jgi:NitT/TauT family transport system substrate-binding protein